VADRGRGQLAAGQNSTANTGAAVARLPVAVRASGLGRHPPPSFTKACALHAHAAHALREDSGRTPAVVYSGAAPPLRRTRIPPQLLGRLLFWRATWRRLPAVELPFKRREGQSSDAFHSGIAPPDTPSTLPFSCPLPKNLGMDIRHLWEEEEGPAAAWRAPAPPPTRGALLTTARGGHSVACHLWAAATGACHYLLLCMNITWLFSHFPQNTVGLAKHTVLLTPPFCPSQNSGSRIRRGTLEKLLISADDGCERSVPSRRTWAGFRTLYAPLRAPPPFPTRTAHALACRCPRRTLRCLPLAQLRTTYQPTFLAWVLHSLLLP